MSSSASQNRVRLAVIWVDWYAYHVARLEGLLSVPEFAGRVVGIEMVGGIGVHRGLKFREPIPGHLPVHTLLPNSSWQQAGQWRLARLVWKKLSSLNPSAVLVPGYATLPALAAALWARVHRRQGILMTESTAYDHVRVPWKEGIKSTLIRTLFDYAVAGGKAHVRYLEQLSFPLSKIGRYYDVVDNAILSTRTSELRRSTVSGVDLPKSPYFLYVGRLAPEKNIDGLLAAWIEYRRQGGSWTLVLVGDGPSAPDLRQQATSSSFGSDVLFAGLRDSNQLPLYYAFAGCFVLPSIREPWGLVVNEAMASGLPVLVSSRCGAAEDLVQEGLNGFTFDPSSLMELTNHMKNISMLSAESRGQMGRESIEIVATYSPHNFGQEVSTLLKMAGARP